MLQKDLQKVSQNSLLNFFARLAKARVFPPCSSLKHLTHYLQVYPKSEMTGPEIQKLKSGPN